MIETPKTITGKLGGFNLIGTFRCSMPRLLQEQNPYGLDWANVELTYNPDRLMWTARIDWHRTRVDVDGESEQQAIEDACKHFLIWSDQVLHSQYTEELNNEHAEQTSNLG